MTSPLPTLYFVRSGLININVGRLWDTGIHGYFWSSATSSRLYSGAGVTGAYYLELYTTGVNPSDGPHNRWFGFPLRDQNILIN